MTLEELSSLITNSTDILAVGIALLVLLFTGIQAFFMFKTYELASDYLNQQKEKSRIDRELEIIYDSMKKIHELRQIWVYWCEIDEKVYEQASIKDPIAYPMIESIGDEFTRKYKEKEASWKEIRMSLRVNFKLLNDEKIKKSYQYIILLEEGTKSKYNSLNSDSKFEKYFNRFEAIPSSFYSKERSLGLNSRFETLLGHLERKYTEKNEKKAA